MCSKNCIMAAGSSWQSVLSELLPRPVELQKQSSTIIGPIQCLQSQWIDSQDEFLLSRSPRWQSKAALQSLQNGNAIYAVELSKQFGDRQPLSSVVLPLHSGCQFRNDCANRPRYATMMPFLRPTP